LRQDQPFAGDGLPDLVQVNLLDGVYRHDTNDGRAGTCCLVNHLPNQLRLNKRPYGIVHCHQIDIRIQSSQSVLHGLLAGVSALHKADRLRPAFLR